MRFVNFTCNFSPGQQKSPLPASWLSFTTTRYSTIGPLVCLFLVSGRMLCHLSWLSLTATRALCESPGVAMHGASLHTWTRKNKRPMMSPPMKRAMIEILLYILFIFKITIYVVCYIYSKMQYIYRF